MSAQDRKLAIVKAALPLFARKGFAETTTKDLARAAGVSEPLLYKHFPSKEALYTEIQNYSCQATDTIVQRLADLKTLRLDAGASGLFFDAQAHPRTTGWHD